MLKNESLIFANFFYLFKENLLIFQSLCNIKNNSYLILLNTLPPPIFTYMPPFTYFIITLPNISSFFFFPFSRSMLCTPLCPVSFYSVLFSLFLILCLHCTSPSIWRIPTPLQTIPFSIAISFSSLWYECFHWVHRPS